MAIQGTRAPKTFLHVGCGVRTPASLPGIFRDPDWQEIRLDINPAVDPDIVASITNMAMVQSGSMDAVFSAHNLEHLYYHEVSLALAEFFRVLKPAGFAVITLPDLQKVAELVASDQLEEMAYLSPAGEIAPFDMLYGLRAAVADGNLFMAHKSGFTAKTLSQALVRTGFAEARVLRDNFNLVAVAHKRLQDVDAGNLENEVVAFPCLDEML